MCQSRLVDDDRVVDGDGRRGRDGVEITHSASIFFDVAAASIARLTEDQLRRSAIARLSCWPVVCHSATRRVRGEPPPCLFVPKPVLTLARRGRAIRNHRRTDADDKRRWSWARVACERDRLLTAIAGHNHLLIMILLLLPVLPITHRT